MSNELITEYLESLQKLEGYTSRTVDRHRRVCRRWQDLLLEQTGRTLVQSLPEDLLTFIERRSADSVTDSTIRQELCVLRTLYDWLHRYQRVDSNPAAALPEMICAPAREKQWLTVDEYVRIMVDDFNHQPSGIEAVRRDLGLLSNYMHANDASRLTGDVLLEFVSHLRIERGNQPGNIKRKISSIRSYIRYLQTSCYVERNIAGGLTSGSSRSTAPKVSPSRALPGPESATPGRSRLSPLPR